MSQLRVGVSLDNVLADSQTRLEMYAKRLEINTDSLWHPRLISDEAFWAGMTAWPDLAFFVEAIAEAGHELFVLSERPASLLSVTRGWLRRKQLPLDHDHLVVNSLHRFDCRGYGIDIFIGASNSGLEKFYYDRVQAISVDRKLKKPPFQDEFKVWHISTLTEALGLSLRKESPWMNA